MNFDAPLNIRSMVVTLDTSHLDRSPLNDDARLNIESMVVTLDTSHLDRSLLNVAYVNILSMLVTLDTSHLERSPLNDDAETNMLAMFASASTFNGDISKWDVSSVTDMGFMFHSASAFAQTLCGAWMTSRADKDGMFDGSPGRLCKTSINFLTTTASSKGNITSMETLPVTPTITNPD